MPTVEINDQVYYIIIIIKDKVDFVELDDSSSCKM